jgi:hypothetical protein
MEEAVQDAARQATGRNDEQTLTGWTSRGAARVKWKTDTLRLETLSEEKQSRLFSKIKIQIICAYMLIRSLTFIIPNILSTLANCTQMFTSILQTATTYTLEVMSCLNMWWNSKLWWGKTVKKRKLVKEARSHEIKKQQCQAKYYCICNSISGGLFQLIRLWMFISGTFLDDKTSQT